MKKKMNLLFLTLIVISIFSFTRSESSNDELPIGTVIYSILPPEYFIAEYSDKWVLLDGSALKETWRLKGILDTYNGSFDQTKNLPNGLGKFTRTMNVNGKGSDPETHRKVGTQQEFTTGKPKKKDFIIENYEDEGHHDHTIDYWGAHQAGDGSEKIPLMAVKDRYERKHEMRSSRREGGHRHKITSRNWDTETRPDNITLYSYIKVN